jgi:hypothetical protein
MTFILLEEVSITRTVNYVYIFRTLLSLGIVFLFIHLTKDKQSLRIGGVTFFIGCAFEGIVHAMGIREYVNADLSHFLLLVVIFAIEIAGATAMIWSISTLLYRREGKWKLKLLLWAGIVLCITIIFPLIAGA